MNASDIKLLDLLSGHKQFLIPIFQRTYSWKEKNCEQLFYDVILVGESTAANSHHFVGSVVTIFDREGRAGLCRLQVIDGQQRLTTITLFILALIKKARSLGKEAIDGLPLESIGSAYLTNPFDGEDRYRLVLTQKDFPTLKALIDGHEEPEGALGKVLRNYQLFYDWLDSEEKLEAAFKGLHRLKVVDVTLHSGQDDPQAIFESLNSTGVDLSQADLIRNFVLMRQSHDKQAELYKHYWSPMEQLFSEQESAVFDRFMQDFLTLHTKSNSLIKARDVYPLFKKWFSEQQEAGKTPDDLLEILRLSGKRYAAFSLLAEKDGDLQAAFRDLLELVKVASPTIMRLYQSYERQTLNKKDFIDAVRYLESYILRRSVCDMQTRSLGNLFATLAQKIDPQKPMESMLVALARFSKNSRYPSDKEFKDALINKDLYEGRNCRYVLKKLNANSKEDAHVKITRDFSIEHIMPRNEKMRKEWKDMLGGDWKDIHQAWLHRLGNLTLTAYNPEYSDKPFKEKKTMEKGFDDSPLSHLNKELRETDVWTEEQMKKRSERLAGEAIEVWRPLLDVSSLIAEYELQDKQKLHSNQTLSDVKGVNEKNEVLIESLEKLIKEKCLGVDTVYSKKNITFHAPEEFIQAIPLTHSLRVVLALEYEELEPELQKLCEDTGNKKFIPNATLDGVYLSIRTCEEIETVTPLVLQAHEEVIA